MKVNKTSNYIGSDDKEKTSNYLRSVSTDLSNLFLLAQNRVRFGDGTEKENIAGEFQTVTTLNAAGGTHTNFPWDHTLDVVPVGYIVVNQNNTGDLYSGTNAWTTSTISLRSNVTDTTFKIFLLR